MAYDLTFTDGPGNYAAVLKMLVDFGIGDSKTLEDAAFLALQKRMYDIVKDQIIDQVTAFTEHHGIPNDDLLETDADEYHRRAGLVIDSVLDPLAPYLKDDFVIDAIFENRFNDDEFVHGLIDEAAKSVVQKIIAEKIAQPKATTNKILSAYGIAAATLKKDVAKAPAATPAPVSTPHAADCQVNTRKPFANGPCTCAAPPPVAVPPPSASAIAPPPVAAPPPVVATPPAPPSEPRSKSYYPIAMENGVVVDTVVPVVIVNLLHNVPDSEITDNLEAATADPFIAEMAAETLLLDKATPERVTALIAEIVTLAAMKGHEWIGKVMRTAKAGVREIAEARASASPSPVGTEIQGVEVEVPGVEVGVGIQVGGAILAVDHAAASALTFPTALAYLRENGGTSETDLARILGTSRTTMMNICDPSKKTRFSETEEQLRALAAIAKGHAEKLAQAAWALEVLKPRKE